MIATATVKDLAGELAELETAARAWFDPPDDDQAGELARLDRVLAATSLVDLARPDTLNVDLVRRLAHLWEWDDAHVFAGVALAALHEAADAIDDDAYTLRYLMAGRDALRLAELVDAPRMHAAGQTEAAAGARRARGFERLQDFVAAWRELPEMKWPAKVRTVGERLSLSDKRIEAMHAEAVALGMLD